MDEAASVAERLGGARFVEALRAHGFSWSRVFLYHIVALNLRPVVVRQAAETLMQVTLLEIALSYLAATENQSSFTHADDFRSWADLLKVGYPSLVLDVPTGHALATGLALVAVVTLMALMTSSAARAR
jgi:ABC-type dipeptide/oligopeptide/nickel transport system permease subunit